MSEVGFAMDQNGNPRWGHAVKICFGRGKSAYQTLNVTFEEDPNFSIGRTARLRSYFSVLTTPTKLVKPVCADCSRVRSRLRLQAVGWSLVTLAVSTLLSWACFGLFLSQVEEPTCNS